MFAKMWNCGTSNADTSSGDVYLQREGGAGIFVE